MENPRPEEEDIINDIRDLFRLRKGLNYTATKVIENLFRLKKETKAIKDRMLNDIKNLCEHEEQENDYKPVRVGNFWSNNYIGHETNGDRNKTLSVKEYLNKIRPHSKDIINNLKKPKKWKIQLTIANNFISSIDNDEEYVVHPKSDTMEIMINEEVDKFTKELFDLLKNKHESNGDRSKTLSVEEYLNKIRPHLKDIINNLKKSEKWKI